MPRPRSTAPDPQSVSETYIAFSKSGAPDPQASLGDRVRPHPILKNQRRPAFDRARSPKRPASPRTAPPHPRHPGGGTRREARGAQHPVSTAPKPQKRLRASGLGVRDLKHILHIRGIRARAPAEARGAQRAAHQTFKPARETSPPPSARGPFIRDVSVAASAPTEAWGVKYCTSKLMDKYI